MSVPDHCLSFYLGSHYAKRTFYEFFVLRTISGPRVKFVQG